MAKLMVAAPNTHGAVNGMVRMNAADLTVSQNVSFGAVSGLSEGRSVVPRCSATFVGAPWSKEGSGVRHSSAAATIETRK